MLVLDIVLVGVLVPSACLLCYRFDISDYEDCQDCSDSFMFTAPTWKNPPVLAPRCGNRRPLSLISGTAVAGAQWRCGSSRSYRPHSDPRRRPASESWDTLSLAFVIRSDKNFSIPKRDVGRFQCRHDTICIRDGSDCTEFTS